jgi:hypothetical protein
MVGKIAQEGAQYHPRQNLSPLAGGGRMKDWHSINMRRKKVFIAIVILLVLGLGLLMDYQRRNRDIEFEVPGTTRGILVDGKEPVVSEHVVAYQDDQDYLIVYDITKHTQSKIPVNNYIGQIAIDEPWIVWSETTQDIPIIQGYHIVQKQVCPILENLKHVVLPDMNGERMVWSENFDIYGYNLLEKVQFPISTEPNREEYPAIYGDIVVWLEFGTEPWSTRIVGYDMKSHKRFVVRDTISAKGNLHVGSEYIVWQERTKSSSDSRFSLMAYHMGSGETMTACSGMDNDSMDVSGPIVVWEEEVEPRLSKDIFGFNLKTRKRFPICTEEDDQYCPKIFGHTVIWCDERPSSRIDHFLKKEPCYIRGKIFRHWPGEGKNK